MSLHEIHHNVSSVRMREEHWNKPRILAGDICYVHSGSRKRMLRIISSWNRLMGWIEYQSLVGSWFATFAINLEPVFNARASLVTWPFMFPAPEEQNYRSSSRDQCQIWNEVKWNHSVISIVRYFPSFDNTNDSLSIWKNTMSQKHYGRHNHTIRMHDIIPSPHLSKRAILPVVDLQYLDPEELQLTLKEPPFPPVPLHPMPPSSQLPFITASSDPYKDSRSVENPLLLLKCVNTGH